MTPKCVRPVTSRALKSSIDTLRPFLHDAHVLDLFCGTGRFGIASLQEGADWVVFVDHDRTVLNQVKKALAGPKSRCETQSLDVFCFLDGISLGQKKFDIVFADPPFRLFSPNFCQGLFEAVGPVVQAGSIFLLKCPKRMVPSASKYFSNWKSSLFGESRLLYFRYERE